MKNIILIIFITATALFVVPRLYLYAAYDQSEPYQLAGKSRDEIKAFVALPLDDLRRKEWNAIRLGGNSMFGPSSWPITVKGFEPERNLRLLINKQENVVANYTEIFIHPLPGQSVFIISTTTVTNQAWPIEEPKLNGQYFFTPTNIPIPTNDVPLREGGWMVPN